MHGVREMTILKGKSPLLYDHNIDGHIGLNDVLLIHEDGKREKISRQEWQRRINKEQKNENIKTMKEAKHGSKSTRRSLLRGGTNDITGHRAKHVKQSKAGKGFSVQSARTSQAGLPGIGGDGLAVKKSDRTNR
jgi:hypothetical protein